MSIQLVPPHARWSFQASTASLAQFQFCSLTTSAQLQTPTATGQFCVVLDDAPSNVNATFANDLYSGGYIVGAYYGVVLPVGVVMKVYYGATLAVGAAVMTDTSGHAIAQSGAGVTLGFTMEAGVSGEIHPIVFNVA